MGWFDLISFVAGISTKFRQSIRSSADSWGGVGGRLPASMRQNARFRHSHPHARFQLILDVVP
ncbi:hypothetical protein ACLOJK_001905 [Asimina triloba]